jgi:hypothetical protein
MPDYKLIISGNNSEFDPDFKFSDQHILHIRDTINIHRIQQVFQTRGKPAYIINDNVGAWHQEINQVPVMGLPLFLKATARSFQQLSLSDDYNTSHCFNFIINKKKINRHLLVKLVEYFDLDYAQNYTYSGIGRFFDMKDTMAEFKLLELLNRVFLDQEGWIRFKCMLLSECAIPTNFISRTVTDSDTVSVGHYGGNLYAWQVGLDQIFQSSAVSLISESNTTQLASTLTEKTGYAILGLTFPIWIGGYNNAKDFEELGFDSFKDIINHDYQNKSTLLERCYFAFRDNLKLLSDLNYAAKMRDRCYERLLNNRRLLLTDNLTQVIRSRVSSWPAPLAAIVNQYWELLYEPNTGPFDAFRDFR